MDELDAVPPGPTLAQWLQAHGDPAAARLTFEGTSPPRWLQSMEVLVPGSGPVAILVRAWPADEAPPRGDVATLPLIPGGWLVDVALPPRRWLRRLTARVRSSPTRPWQRVAMLVEDGFTEPEQFRPLDDETVVVTLARRPITRS